MPTWHDLDSAIVTRKSTKLVNELVNSQAKGAGVRSLVLLVVVYTLGGFEKIAASMS